jgi:hypothetical protein
MKSKICCLLLLMAAWTQLAAGSKCEFAEFAQDYFTALANTRTTVLYSQCKQAWGKSVLIVPVLAASGESGHLNLWGPYYPELQGRIVLFHLSQTCTESFATIRIDDDGHTVIANTSGGPEVRSWTARLVGRMEKLPFRIMPPDKLKDIVNSRPVQNCE